LRHRVRFFGAPAAPTFYENLKIYFTPLADALKSICADDMGKDALKAALKKVTLTNEGHHSSPSGFSFEKGVLTLDHGLSNIGDVTDRKKAIEKLLEKAL
jgi:hypothetical protein